MKDLYPNPIIERPINIGLFGGAGGFIGDHHGAGIIATGRFKVTALCLSRNIAKTKAHRHRYGVEEKHCYANIADMLAGEGDKLDAVSIAVPDKDHFGIALAALQAGKAVALDKPLTLTLAEALTLLWVVIDKKLPFLTTHTYLGYPIMVAIRNAILAGNIGKLRAIVTNYLQGWLWFKLEDPSNSDKGGHQQAVVRTGQGISCCYADIGIHALMNALFPTGLEPTGVSATLRTFVAGRVLDDHATAVFRCGEGDNSPIITCTSSQVAIGHENNLSTTWAGENGAITFDGLQPNYAQLYETSGNPQIMCRAGHATSSVPGPVVGMPGGHPEGTPEGFRNLYWLWANTVEKWLAGEEPEVIDVDYPGIRQGVVGMHSIEQVVASHKAGGAWTPMKTWAQLLALRS